VVSRILDAGETGEAFTLEVREVTGTIFFSDLVGFTTLTEHMPPGEVASMLNEYFSRMADIIFQHEGTLDKFIGDAIMAIFGAPIDSEDHARRAVLCALEMKKALREFNEENAQSRTLRFRIGINTGPVVAGDIGSIRRMEYTVLGTTVNVASRLESEVAEPGQIVVGEETYKAIKDEFVCERVGRVKVKGLSQPLVVYEVKGPIESPTAH
jgi:adenylate cyclase